MALTYNPFLYNMKKTILLAALALTAVTSWAFYPKAAEPTGYMMVIGRTYTNYSLITIAPTGEIVTQVIDEHSYNNTDKSNKAASYLNQAEIRKINELKQAGWKVTSMSNNARNLMYLLEK